MNPYYYMAWDPGEKSSGLAHFNEDGILTGIHSIKNGLKGIIEWWNTRSGIADPFVANFGKDMVPHVMICETYRIKNWQHAHNLSKVPAIRVIGWLEGLSYRYRAEWVEQESSCMYSGIKWSGNEVPKGHVPDHLSALGHGVYYLYKFAKKWEIKL